MIAYSTFGTSSYSNIVTGLSNEPSFVPNVFLPYTEQMNFWQRLHNLIAWKTDELFLHFLHFPKQKRLYEKHFPHVRKSFDEQHKSVSLFLNSNYFVSSTVRPEMKNSIDIGGIHVEPAKPLPKDIQEFLDSATKGAILFSMGSIIQAVHWPIDKREALVKAFGKLEQKVLWKYENETLPNKPDNVMISPWIPQRDILAHPNVKLFMTHGGLLGTTEALVEGVPVLGIPVFGDQRMNLNLATLRGYAKTIKFEELSEECLSKALNLILKDSKISSKAKKISKIYTDRPMTPQQAVVYWVEYVIRHDGAPLLRSASLDLTYFEMHSFDVYAFLITTLSFFVLFVQKIVKFTCKKVLLEKNQKLKKN